MNFVKNTLGAATIAPSLRRGENNWTTLASTLANLHNHGLKIDWSEYHRPFETSLRLLDLPTYAWNNKNYWIQYNGDWALTKGNTFYAEEKGLTAKPQAAQSVSPLSTSLVQQIISEDFDISNGTAKVTMQSDLMQPDFRAAAWGHRMNNCGVVTSVSTSAIKKASQLLICLCPVHPRRYRLHSWPICVQQAQAQEQGRRPYELWQS